MTPRHSPHTACQHGLFSKGQGKRGLRGGRSVSWDCCAVTLWAALLPSQETSCLGRRTPSHSQPARADIPSWGLITCPLVLFQAFCTSMRSNALRSNLLSQPSTAPSPEHPRVQLGARWGSGTEETDVPGTKPELSIPSAGAQRRNSGQGLSFWKMASFEGQPGCQAGRPSRRLGIRARRGSPGPDGLPAEQLPAERLPPALEASSAFGWGDSPCVSSRRPHLEHGSRERRHVMPPGACSPVSGVTTDSKLEPFGK